MNEISGGQDPRPGALLELEEGAAHRQRAEAAARIEYGCGFYYYFDIYWYGYVFDMAHAGAQSLL